MAVPSNSAGNGDSDEARLRIYLLPNLLTAGNLFCGFLAITRVVEADINSPTFPGVIREAILFIILACVFDLLDGRVARMGGFESPFGREFDSLADIVSFGVAPAFLVHRVVLRDVFVDRPELGWFIASIYLICGAFRLARFNCLATMNPDEGGGKEFVGFPIPAAAGLIASLTLFLLWWKDKVADFKETPLRYALPVILVFLSAMMVSQVKYPTFKKLDWRAQRPFVKMVIIAVVIGFVVILREKILPPVLPLVFTAYLVYGFIRPRISKQMIRDIEDNDEEEAAPPGASERGAGAPAKEGK
ncbi:MAG: CDP-diacylglycerol--serine O-phosphatidyltransferase [Verrucomicrobia bacterium]|nr:CDP-diacylglycerol--serine O-phosphatidyltransferase [Verrucomicrobiota bacterium]